MTGIKKHLKFLYNFPFLINKYLILGTLLLFICVGCDETSNNNHITQGIIEYEITYINQSEKKIPIQLMPKTLELKFNKSFSSYTIEDRLGLFCIQNILNYKESNHITLIKVFDKKYAYTGTSKEPPILFDAKNKYKINYLNDTSRLAGFLCNTAEIKDSDIIFNVYYTKNIEIKNPNKNTPYETIDGMLLNFRLKMKTLDLKLNAKKFQHKIIKDNEFEIPNGYKKITRKQMEDIITTILP